MTTGRVLVLSTLILATAGIRAWAQDGSPTASTFAFSRILDRFGSEAEHRFVRAYSHLEKVEFHQLSTEFLQNREQALRKFLRKFPMAEQAHEARILLAHTLLYRDAGEEAESLLKMVILTTEDRKQEYRARFTLSKYYRRKNPLKARVYLEELKSTSKTDAYRARACFELSMLLPPSNTISVLREGGALTDGEYQRMCRLKLAHLTLRTNHKLEESKPSRPFRIKDLSGKVFTHEDFKGEVYLIYFWSVRAKNAKKDRSFLASITRNHAYEGLHIIGVNMDGNPDALKKAVENKRYPWIEVGDRWGPLNELALRYAPDPPPFFVLVDRKGLIRHRGDALIPDSTTQFLQAPLWKKVVIALKAIKDPGPLSSHAPCSPEIEGF